MNGAATAGQRPSGLRRWMPGLNLLSSYRVPYLGRDLAAGLVLTTLLVPQGMAYAQLAGLPPVTGLYTSIFCLIGYAVFGPSRILVLGPDSALGPMIAAAIIPIIGSGGDPKKAVALASVLALMVGLTMGIAGLGKLGFVADLLAKPTRLGYLNGLALTILVGQVPKLCGFSVAGDGLIAEATGTVKGLFSGDAVPASVTIGVLGLAAILAMRLWAPRLPAILITVVGFTIIASLFDAGSHGVDLVGALPQGFPPFVVPHASWSELGPLAGAALGITLVALTDTISTATAFAARSGQEVRPNQEMVGIGAANVAASFFQGFPVSTSASRSAVAEQSGARTQVTGLVGAVGIMALLLIAPGLLKNLPQPTLAAVVMAAALSLADIAGMRRLWHQRRTEFSLGVAAFLGVALLGVLAGIAIAVGLSVLNVFRRAWWPYQTVLGEAKGIDGYHDLRVYPDATCPPGLVLFRFDAPLIFANVRTFRHQIRKLARTDPPPAWIVVAAEPITDVDTTAADLLEELDNELNASGVSLVFAEMKTPVQNKIQRYGLARTIGPEHFFPTLDEAVAAFRRRDKVRSGRGEVGSGPGKVGSGPGKVGSGPGEAGSGPGEVGSSPGEVASPAL